MFLLCFIGTKVGRGVSLPEIPIGDIRFEGIGTLDEMELLEKLSMDTGTNLLNIDLKRARETLLLSEPLIKDVEIRRNFYSRELSIKLRLREAIALLNYNGIYGIDDDGVLLGKLGRIIPRDLAIISGVRLKDASIGQRIKSKHLDQALEIHRGKTKSFNLPFFLSFACSMK